jgi:hypothetical protein
MLFNIFVKKKETINSLKKDLTEKGKTNEKIKEAVSKIHKEFTKAKAEVSSGKSNFNQMKNIFDSYPAAYQFQKGKIYYDVKARPDYHYKALYLLSLEVGKLKKKSFSPFPLRKTWIPCYMTVDTEIAKFHILEKTDYNKDSTKEDVWAKMVNLKRKPVRELFLRMVLDYQ